jgi:hypothetical protein
LAEIDNQHCEEGLVCSTNLVCKLDYIEYGEREIGKLALWFKRNVPEYFFFWRRFDILD